MRKDLCIVLFAYNRPTHFNKIFNSLQGNKEFNNIPVDLYIDGAREKGDKKCAEMKKLGKKLAQNHKNIHLIISPMNKGCRKSVIEGVTKSLNQYKRAIILEDDILVSETFLEYMIDALDYYEDIKNVACITGYNHTPQLMEIPKEYRENIYFGLRTCSWGWATWVDRWKVVDWEVKDFYKFRLNIKERYKFSQWGEDLFDMLSAQMRNKINAWDIVWTYHCFKNNLYTVYPVKSFVENIGHDDSGENCKASEKEMFVNENLNVSRNIKFIKPMINDKMFKAFQKVYVRDFNYYRRKIKSKIKKVLKI